MELKLTFVEFFHYRIQCMINECLVFLRLAGWMKNMHNLDSAR